MRTMPCTDYPLFMRTIPQPCDFDEYDRAHPDIWEHFERIALDLIRRGVKHYGSKAIFEIIRYHRTLDSGRNDFFRVNNNFTSRYARKFQSKHPQHADFFETRKAKA